MLFYGKTSFVLNSLNTIEEHIEMCLKQNVYLESMQKL